MKKFAVLMIVLIIMVSAILPLIILNSFRKTLIDDLGLNYIGEEQLCDVFAKNKRIFNESVNALAKLEIQNKDYCLFDDLMAIHNLEGEYSIERGTRFFDTSLVKNLNRGLLLVRRSEGIFETNVINEINNSPIYRIIKELNFKKIVVGHKYVLFVNINSPFVAAILYTELDVPESIYRCEMKKISDNWYYCITE